MESQEQAFAGALVGLEFQDVFSVHEHFTRGDLVIGMTAENLCQSALARAVRPHDGMHLALFDGKAQATHDFLAGNGDM